MFSSISSFGGYFAEIEVSAFFCLKFKPIKSISSSLISIDTSELKKVLPTSMVENVIIYD